MDSPIVFKVHIHLPTSSTVFLFSVDEYASPPSNESGLRLPHAHAVNALHTP